MTTTSAYSNAMNALKSQDTRLIALCILIAASFAAKTSYASASQGDLQFSAEVKPLSLLLNVLPGATGISVAGEVPLRSNFVLVLGASHMNWNLQENIRKELAKGNDGDPVPSRFNVNEATSGVRYYRDLEGDTWYAGALASYGVTVNEYTYKDEELDEKSKAVTGGAECGYRWVWDSGVLLRLAGTAKNQFSISQSIDSDDDVTTSTAAVSEGIKRLKDNRGSFKSYGYGIDFGLGYVF